MSHNFITNFHQTYPLHSKRYVGPLVLIHYAIVKWIWYLITSWNWSQTENQTGEISYKYCTIRHLGSYSKIPNTTLCPPPPQMKKSGYATANAQVFTLGSTDNLRPSANSVTTETLSLRCKTNWNDGWRLSKECYNRYDPAVLSYRPLWLVSWTLVIMTKRRSGWRDTE